MPHNVLIIERYTTPEGATVIRHYCYVQSNNWICRCNSRGEIIQHVLNVCKMPDVAFVGYVLDWHRHNVAPAGAKLDWQFVY